MLVASGRSAVTRRFAELLARVTYPVHTQPRLMPKASQGWHLGTTLQNSNSPLSKRDEI